MCLIALDWQPQAAIRLIVAANRDEFYARPTLPLNRWADQPIVAGKDLQAGGTWLGVSTTGRVAALTNYRDVSQLRATAPSRGDITAAFLADTCSAEAYLEELARQASSYNPFNLLVFDGNALWGFESRHQRAFPLPEGVSAVSNADFNVPWPKLSRLRDGFAATMRQHRMTENPQMGDASRNALFDLLAERRTAPDAVLPHTGISVERERALSAEFIHTPDYGTRSSSLLYLGHSRAELTERTFDATGFKGETRQHISWQAAA
jgi:uncharacterized protein with NRDE domain